MEGATIVVEYLRDIPFLSESSRVVTAGKFLLDCGLEDPASGDAPYEAIIEEFRRRITRAHGGRRLEAASPFVRVAARR